VTERAKLYGLFKQATQGDVSDSAGANLRLWDVVGRAKHESWAQHKGMSQTAAGAAYAAAVSELDPSFRQPSETDDSDTGRRLLVVGGHGKGTGKGTGEGTVGPEEEEEEERRRRVVSVERLKIGIKAAAPGATVNDAVMAAVAGAIGELAQAASSSHAQGEGDAKEAPPVVTALVPVNLRPLLAALTGNIPDPKAPLAVQVEALQGNKIGGLFVDLPTSTAPTGDKRRAHSSPCPEDEAAAAAAALLREVAARMWWCKAVPEALASYAGAVAVALTLPVAVQKAAQFHVLGQADVAVSNVKGPDTTVHVLGRAVTQMVGFLPPPNGCPLGIAVTSYRGALQLSVNADAGAMSRLCLPGKESDGPTATDALSTPTRTDAATNAPLSGGGGGGGGGAEALLAAVEGKLGLIAKQAKTKAR